MASSGTCVYSTFIYSLLIVHADTLNILFETSYNLLENFVTLLSNRWFRIKKMMSVLTFYEPLCTITEA